MSLHIVIAKKSFEPNFLEHDPKKELEPAPKNILSFDSTNTFFEHP